MGGDGWTVLGGWWDLRFGGGTLAGFVSLCGCVYVVVCVYQRKKMRTSSDLLKGNLVIAHRVQQIVDSTRTDFFQNGPLSSFPTLCVLFTNPKCKFFQKVVFWS